MSPSRVIDTLPAPKNPPKIEVIVACLPRTGGTSLEVALGMLGYKSLYREKAYAKPVIYSCMTEAHEAKFHGACRPYERADWDKVFEGYNCIVHLPGTLMWDDIVKAYPEAKVIMPIRDPSAMAGSFEKAIESRYQWTSYDWIAPLSPNWVRTWWPFLKLQGQLKEELVQGGDKIAFAKAFMKSVRNTVPEGNLLEFSPKNGWGPLCDFLGQEVPEQDYPHANSVDQHLENHEAIYRWALSIVIGEFAVAGTVALGAAAGLRYWLS